MFESFSSRFSSEIFLGEENHSVSFYSELYFFFIIHLSECKFPKCNEIWEIKLWLPRDFELFWAEKSSCNCFKIHFFRIVVQNV